ncbi:NKL protein, partial [Rhynochetos jubatus]|nr:NKL protein [Rhynochetos jubatus]
DVAAPGRVKCSLCTKVLQQIRALAGEDPDEAAVQAALDKACRALGKRLGRKCKGLVKKYQDTITEALQNGDMPRDTCVTIGFCKA